MNFTTAKTVQKILLLPLLVLGCGEIQIPKPKIHTISQEIKSPTWYQNRNIPKNSFEIIGYGFGNNENEAKQNARKDIAEQISIKVKSENFKTEKRIGQKSQTSFVNISTQKTYLTLSNLEIIRISNNRKFVALKYLNLPFEKKFLNKIGKYKCGSQNSFLENTKFGKLAIQTNNCLPNILIFKNHNSLFINSGNISELLPHLSTLFFTKSDSHISLNIPDIVKERDEFDIQFSTSTNGFVNILMITDKGEVFEIISNYFSEKREKISVGQILDKHFFGMVENKEEFEDSMFIGIFSKNNLEDNFLKIRDENQKYQEINFSRFLELFHNNIFNFTSKIIRIKTN